MKLMATPTQSNPQHESLWETILAGLFAFLVLPVLAYILMVMLTQPQRVTKITDTSDVTVVENGLTCRVWSAPLFSNQKPRKVCHG